MVKGALLPINGSNNKAQKLVNDYLMVVYRKKIKKNSN